MKLYHLTTKERQQLSKLTRQLAELERQIQLPHMHPFKNALRKEFKELENEYNRYVLSLEQKEDLINEHNYSELR